MTLEKMASSSSSAFFGVAAQTQLVEQAQKHLSEGETLVLAERWEEAMVPLQTSVNLFARACESTSVILVSSLLDLCLERKRRAESVALSEELIPVVERAEARMKEICWLPIGDEIQQCVETFEKCEEAFDVTANWIHRRKAMYGCEWSHKAVGAQKIANRCDAIGRRMLDALFELQRQEQPENGYLEPFSTMIRIEGFQSAVWTTTVDVTANCRGLLHDILWPDSSRSIWDPKCTRVHCLQELPGHGLMKASHVVGEGAFTNTARDFVIIRKALISCHQTDSEAEVFALRAPKTVTFL